MLQGVGPSVALGEDTNCYDVFWIKPLGGSAKRWPINPRLKPNCGTSLGGFTGAGVSGQGEKMVRQALEIHQKAFGSESLEAAASLNLLGRQLMGQLQTA